MTLEICMKYVYGVSINRLRSEKKTIICIKKKHNKHHIPLILEVTKCGKSVLQLRKWEITNFVPVSFSVTKT